MGTTTTTHTVPPWSLGNHTIAFVVAARTVSTYGKILIPSCRLRNSTPWTTLLRVTSGVRRIVSNFSFGRRDEMDALLLLGGATILPVIRLYSPFLHRKCINHHVKGCLVQTFILHSISSVLLVNSSSLM